MRLNCLFYMTAEEFLKSNGCGTKIQNGVDYYYDVTLEDIIEFAKYHVEQALKEASIKATAHNKAKFKGDINPQVDIDSILNAYSLKNIK